MATPGGYRDICPLTQENRMRAHLPIALLVAAMLLAACNDTPLDTNRRVTEAPSATATASPDAVIGMDDQALDRVVEAAEATAEAGTVRFEITIETSDTPGQDGVQPISAEGEEDFDAQQRAVTFQGAGGELLALIDDTDVYVEVPGTEDDTWARVELDSLVAGDVGFGGPAGLPFRSAADNLQALQSAVVAAAEGGPEDVQDESMTRYDLTVDLTEAAEQAAEANQTWEALAEQSGITELDMQVWVDDSDLIRRVAYSLDLSQAEIDAATEGAEVDAAPQGVVTVVVDYFDFGADVEIELPDEDSIVDIDEEEIRDSLQGG